MPYPHLPALSAKVSTSKLHTERATKCVTSLNNPSLNHNLTYGDIQGIQKLTNLFQLCWRIRDKNLISSGFRNRTPLSERNLFELLPAVEPLEVVSWINHISGFGIIQLKCLSP